MRPRRRTSSPPSRPASPRRCLAAAPRPAFRLSRAHPLPIGMDQCDPRWAADEPQLARTVRTLLVPYSPTHERELRHAPHHDLPLPPRRRRDRAHRRRARPPHADRRERARRRVQPRQQGGGLLRGGPGDTQVAGVQGPRRRLRHPAALRLERGQHRQRRRAAQGADPGRQALLGQPREVPRPGLGPHRLAGHRRRPRRLRLQDPRHGCALRHDDDVHHQAGLRPHPAPEVVRPRHRAGRRLQHHPHRHRRLLRLRRHPPGALRPPHRLHGVAAQRQPRGLLQLLGRHLRLRRRHHGTEGRGPDRGRARRGRPALHREPQGPRRRRAAPALSADTTEAPASPLPLALAGAGALAAFGAGSILLARRRNQA